MINIQFVFGFIGAAIGIIIGILVFGQIVAAVNCPGEIGTIGANGETIDDKADFDAQGGDKVQGYKECQSAKNTAWTVLGILPITLFFVLFSICLLYTSPSPRDS